MMQTGDLNIRFRDKQGPNSVDWWPKYPVSDQAHIIV
jgi:hypothetical protein